MNLRNTTLVALTVIGMFTSLNVQASNEEAVIDNNYSVKSFYKEVNLANKMKRSDKLLQKYNPMAMNTDTAASSYDASGSYHITPSADERYIADFANTINFVEGESLLELNYEF